MGVGDHRGAGQTAHGTCSDYTDPHTSGSFQAGMWSTTRMSMLCCCMSWRAMLHHVVTYGWLTSMLCERSKVTLTLCLCLDQRNSIHLDKECTTAMSCEKCWLATELNYNVDYAVHPKMGELPDHDATPRSQNHHPNGSLQAAACNDDMTPESCTRLFQTYLIRDRSSSAHQAECNGMIRDISARLYCNTLLWVDHPEKFLQWCGESPQQNRTQ